MNLPKASIIEVAKAQLAFRRMMAASHDLPIPSNVEAAADRGWQPRPYAPVSPREMTRLMAISAWNADA